MPLLEAVVKLAAIKMIVHLSCNEAKGVGIETCDRYSEYLVP